jgi:hypothetical protein
LEEAVKLEVVGGVIHRQSFRNLVGTEHLDELLVSFQDFSCDWK